MTEITTERSAPGGDAVVRRTIFVECTNTYHSPVQTGIQRVVRSVLRHAGAAGAARGYDIVPVVCERGALRRADLTQVLLDKLSLPPPPPPVEPLPVARHPRDIVISAIRPGYLVARRWLAVLLPFPAAQRFLVAPPSRVGLAWCLLLPWRAARRVVRTVVPMPPPPPPAEPKDAFGPSLDATADHTGDILLLLDASWSLPLWPAVARFQASGGMTHGVIYDLVPITHSETSERSLHDEYVDWVDALQRVGGTFHTISRTVGRQLEEHLARRPGGGARAQVGAFYLGTELDFFDPMLAPRPEIAQIFTGDAHVFIVVGSLEPRKNHGFILDAFDRFWQQGGTARLVIIGRFGWKNEAIVARLADHEQLGRTLFVVRDMSDSELDHAYRQASALVIASEAEGFGLPIVEAFQRGLRVMCSDIAVFREIADGRAMFFDLATPQNLADAAHAFCAENDPARRSERHPQPWITWRESTEQLLDSVIETRLLQAGMASTSI